MGMRIGGNHSNRQVMHFGNAEGVSAGTVSVTRPSAKKKKRLPYNFKEISTQIMLAKTSGGAARVAAKAHRNVIMLQKKRRSGEYDDKEVEQAMIHAKKLVRIAKKRKKHLEQEEKAKGSESRLVEEGEYEKLEAEDTGEGGKEEQDREALEELAEECREMMDESMEELYASMEEAEEAMGLRELADEFLGGAQKELDPEELERLKKKHRSEELKEIIEADMKYLKALFDKMEKERQEGFGGVSLQLGGMEMPVQVMEQPPAAEGGKVDVSL